MAQSKSPDPSSRPTEVGAVRPYTAHSNSFARLLLPHSLAVLFLLLASTSSWAQPARGPSLSRAQVALSLSHQGDTSHMEFAGPSVWNYEIQRENRGAKAVAVLNLEGVEASELKSLSEWSSPLVSSAKIIPGSSPQHVTVELTLTKPSVQIFDYQTDQPSRLILDFFEKTESAGAKSEAPKRAQTPTNTLAKSRAAPSESKKAKQKIFSVKARARGGGQPERKPANDGWLNFLGSESEQAGAQRVAEPKAQDLPEAPGAQRATFDGSDPDFKRFRISDYEIKESAIIASQQNIYLRYPLLHLEPPLFKALEDRPPKYEIEPEDSQENREARFLLTLFERKRKAAFAKTLNHFEKKYPQSKFREMSIFMGADLAYDTYKQSKQAEDFEHAITLYTDAVTAFPDSLLAERTALLTGYAFLQRKNYLRALKTFQGFLRDRPNSKFRDTAKMAMAEAFTGLGQFSEAITALQDLVAHPSKPANAAQGLYRVGDVAFQHQDYVAAVNAYDQAFKSFPQNEGEYPNAHFNRSEALFWSGQYKKSLEGFRTYLQKFNDDVYGGYSLTRVGELLEILGADGRRVMGAFLESYFRYGDTPGGKVARVRLLSQRAKSMKPKELEKAMQEAQTIAKESKLADMPEFVTIVLSDGLYLRREYDKAIAGLVEFYQNNPSSKNLAFIENRIRRNIAQKIRAEVDSGDFMAALRTHSRYHQSWLKKSDRIDIDFNVGRAFEMAGASREAQRIYKDCLNRLYSLGGTKLEKERNVFEVLPSSETLNLRLAAAQMHQGELVKAEATLNQITNKKRLSEPELIERAEIEAQIFAKTGRTQQAIRALAELIQAWRGQAERVAGPLLRLAELLQQSGDPARAQLALTRILNLQTDTGLVAADTHSLALERLGDIYLKEKKIDQAVEAYTTLLDAYEKDRPLASVRYRLGEIEFKRGQSKKAERIWQLLNTDQGKMWYLMAQEQLRNEQFRSDYKRYIQRIPAMNQAPSRAEERGG